MPQVAGCPATPKLSFTLTGTPWKTPRDFPLACASSAFFGLSESVFAKLVNESVELRIIAVDAREHAFGEFERGNLFFADGFGYRHAENFNSKA